MKKIKQNKLHTQTHHSFLRFKIFTDFYRISTPFILQTRTKTLKALYQWSATCGPFSNFSWAASYLLLQSFCGPHASRT